MLQDKPRLLFSHRITSKLLQAQHRFFAIFNTKKKFYETHSIKLLLKPLVAYISKNFTNYF